jgi:ribonuclease P protein component
MKRYVREAFRRRRARLPGWDLVVNVRPSACPCAQRDVDHELASLLRRARRALAS